MPSRATQRDERHFFEDAEDMLAADVGTGMMTKIRYLDRMQLTGSPAIAGTIKVHSWVRDKASKIGG